MQSPDLNEKEGFRFAKTTGIPEGQSPKKPITWTTHRVPQPAGQVEAAGPFHIGNTARQRVHQRRMSPSGQEGTLCALSSEPDLITAHTGHSVDVTQHGEADETSAGEEAAGLWI